MTNAAEVLLVSQETKPILLSKIPRESYITTLDKSTAHRGFLQHLAMWIWIGWIFFYGAFFLATPILYYYCPNLLATVVGLIIFSAIMPIDKRLQPKVCINSSSNEYGHCHII